eukprot:Cvel_11601.t1-p1 / transcript=Cvel_11601.t1 / gene=Cvel_11601 / organism=Chromera_velia_CCMP2878 / gene_product=hypothetical protein / transcript_product=hypothetical protein / location=Cvel_scaffold734:12037-15535(-) / protein_length=792 / sequence_SO=supercontig / SO=protein_coding / is_pseudo=false
MFLGSSTKKAAQTMRRGSTLSPERELEEREKKAIELDKLQADRSRSLGPQSLQPGGSSTDDRRVSIAGDRDRDGEGVRRESISPIRRDLLSAGGSSSLRSFRRKPSRSSVSSANSLEDVEVNMSASVSNDLARGGRRESGADEKGGRRRESHSQRQQGDDQAAAEDDGESEPERARHVSRRKSGKRHVSVDGGPPRVLNDHEVAASSASHRRSTNRNVNRMVQDSHASSDWQNQIGRSADGLNSSAGDDGSRRGGRGEGRTRGGPGNGPVALTSLGRDERGDSYLDLSASYGPAAAVTGGRQMQRGSLTDRPQLHHTTETGVSSRAEAARVNLEGSAREPPRILSLIERRQRDRQRRLRADEELYSIDNEQALALSQRQLPPLPQIQRQRLTAERVQESKREIRQRVHFGHGGKGAPLPTEKLAERLEYLTTVIGGGKDDARHKSSGLSTDLLSLSLPNNYQRAAPPVPQPNEDFTQPSSHVFSPSRHGALLEHLESVRGDGPLEGISGVYTEGRDSAIRAIQALRQIGGDRPSDKRDGAAERGRPVHSIPDTSGGAMDGFSSRALGRVLSDRPLPSDFLPPRGRTPGEGEETEERSVRGESLKGDGRDRAPSVAWTNKSEENRHAKREGEDRRPTSRVSLRDMEEFEEYQKENRKVSLPGTGERDRDRGLPVAAPMAGPLREGASAGRSSGPRGSGGGAGPRRRLYTERGGGDWREGDPEVAEMSREERDARYRANEFIVSVPPGGGGDGRDQDRGRRSRGKTQTSRSRPSSGVSRGGRSETESNVAPRLN